MRKKRLMNKEVTCGLGLAWLVVIMVGFCSVRSPIIAAAEDPNEPATAQAGLDDKRPMLESIEGNFKSQGYDEKEKAYVLTCEPNTDRIEFRLLGSEETPVKDPTFVLKKWGKSPALLWVDEERVESGDDYRTGVRHRLEGVDRIAWVKIEAEDTVQFVFRKEE